jgi:hypothetical protein
MAYWTAVLGRAFASAWNWPNSNAYWFLGIAAILGGLFTAAAVKIFRLDTIQQSPVLYWAEKFGMTVIVGALLTLIGSCAIFFVQDPPTQMANAEKQIEELTKKIGNKPNGEFSAMFLWPEAPKSALRNVSFHIILDNTMSTPAIMTDLRIIRLSTRHDLDNGRFSILSHCLDKISPISWPQPTDPPWNVGDDIQLTELQKESISIDGTAVTDAISVNPKENKYLSVAFTAMVETDFTRYNIQDLCMVIYYYQHDAGRKSVICSGTEVKTPLVPRIPNSPEWFFGPTLSPIPIYPEINDKICLASPF